MSIKTTIFQESKKVIKKTSRETSTKITKKILLKNFAKNFLLKATLKKISKKYKIKIKSQIFFRNGVCSRQPVKFQTVRFDKILSRTTKILHPNLGERSHRFNMTLQSKI